MRKSGKRSWVGKFISRNFLFHFGTGAFGLLFSVAGNWLTSAAGIQFEAATGTLVATLISATLACLAMYANYMARWSIMENPEEVVARASVSYVSEGLVYSLVTMLYSWCSGGRSLSLESTASLLVSLAPYIQGHWEVVRTHEKVSQLYEAGHDILVKVREKFRSQNQPVRIHQNWLMNEMSKMKVTKGLLPQALANFCTHKLKAWKDENPDLEIGTDSNGLVFVHSRD